VVEIEVDFNAAEAGARVFCGAAEDSYPAPLFVRGKEKSSSFGD